MCVHCAKYKEKCAYLDDDEPLESEGKVGSPGQISGRKKEQSSREERIWLRYCLKSGLRGTLSPLT